jgi:hypothetical protein
MGFPARIEESKWDIMSGVLGLPFPFIYIYIIMHGMLVYFGMIHVEFKVYQRQSIG